MKPFSTMTWKRLLALVLAAAVILCVTATGASATANHSEIVRVGYYENEVFEEGANEGAVKKGYAYEYYRKLSEYTGWKYEYVYGTFGDLYQDLLDGKIDMLAGLAWKEERAGLISYPDDPMGHETYNLVKHDSDSSITSDPLSLNGKKIGVLNSAMLDSLNQFLKGKGVEAIVVAYPDYEQLFPDFDSGKLDILAAEGDGAYGRTNAELVLSFGSSDYFLCVNNKRLDLLIELNRAQSQLATEEPNYINSLRTKYYPVSLLARAFSDSEKKWLETHSQLRVGYLENYIPYSDTDQNGNVTGIIKDLIPEILNGLEVSEIEVTYQGYKSYDDMMADISREVIDVAFPVGGGLYYSEENGIYLSSPVITSGMELVFEGEYSEQKTKHFAVNENNRMQYYYIQTYYPDAKITLYPSTEDCLEAVLSEKVSCTTLNGLRASDILKNNQYKGLSLRQTSHNDDRCFGVEIGNEGLLKLLNRGINMLGEDYGQNLSYRYMSSLYSYTAADLIADNVVLFVALILAVAALIIFLLVRDSQRKKKEVREKEAARKELEAKNRELSENKEALSEALAAAERANRAKTTFLNNMSHDIRTPMNAIVGFTALAASHIDNKEQVRDYLGKIAVSSRHLLSLINDVLDMSRIESGKVTINETEVHLPDIVHDLRDIILTSINAKKQELFIDTQDVMHEDVITDRLRLNQVLLNILSNANKFTPDGGIISFRLIEKPSSSPEYAHFEFRVKDNGIGMSEEFQKTIFEAFTREQTSTVSGIQGTGLGMAITKNNIEMMGGSIQVKSQEGKGSEFIVDLPCKISNRSAKCGTIPELQGLRALVADDDPDTCLSVCAMLRSIGMRPDWTNYGKEAVIRAKEAFGQADEFRVYIIDWLIPDQNGVETVRQIRSVIGDSAPIIILTAYDWADVEEEAREAGVTAFCAKPLFLSELHRLLAEPFMKLCENSEPKQPGVPAVSGKRILLAEDNEMNCIIAAAILEEDGYAVEIAYDGEEAVEKMKTKPSDYYNVILMDIQMPRMNGYEAAKQIRGLDDPVKANIPIVAVTANAFEEDKATALAAGMNGHLAKPYDIPSIRATLERLLK